MYTLFPQCCIWFLLNDIMEAKCCLLMQYNIKLFNRIDTICGLFNLFYGPVGVVIHIIDTN
jgi:hypothetical protein